MNGFFVGGLLLGLYLGSFTVWVVLTHTKSDECVGKGGVYAEGKCYEKKEMKE